MSSKSSLGVLLIPAFAVLALAGFVMLKRRAAAERWHAAETHLVGFRESLQSDARELIQAWKEEERAGPIDRSLVPASLLVPGLQYAETDVGHVKLVLYDSPDVKSGFRLWVAELPEDYQDQPTSIPFVWRFLHIDDRPSSPSNRP